MWSQVLPLGLPRRATSRSRWRSQRRERPMRSRGLVFRSETWSEFLRGSISWRALVTGTSRRMCRSTSPRRSTLRTCSFVGAIVQSRSRARSIGPTRSSVLDFGLRWRPVRRSFCAETSAGSASAASSLGRPWRATISTSPFGTASLFQAFSGTARFMSTMNRAKGADATNLTCCSTGQCLESRCGTRLRPSNESSDELFNDPNYGGELQNLPQAHSRSVLDPCGDLAFGGVRHHPARRIVAGQRYGPRRQPCRYARCHHARSYEWG